MKFLLEIFDKFKPIFEKGGKLEKLYPLFEANDTFLFTPSDITREGAHVRDQIDMKRMMMTVVIAMVPCILFGFYNTGHQHMLVNNQPYYPIMNSLPPILLNFAQGALIVLPIIVVSYAAGGICEVIFSVIRKHEINEGFLVTGMLFALILPPEIPLWMVAVGICFGVVIGKEVFGGTGMNILNPALTARAFLFFSYPGEMTGDNVWTSTMKENIEFAGHVIVPKSEFVLDGFTGATPLSVTAAAEPGTNILEALHSAPFGVSTMPSFDFWNMFWGNMGGSIGETSTFACILGAVLLIVTGIGSWRIMVSMVAGLLITALVCNWGAVAFKGPEKVHSFFLLPASYHLVMGGFAFGCVFMATDPVSAAVTERGKIIYGFLAGFLVYIFRVINPAFPEGVMLAILFMNMMAPLIDHFVVNANIKRRLKRGSL